MAGLREGFEDSNFALCYDWGKVWNGIKYRGFPNFFCPFKLCYQRIHLIKIHLYNLVLKRIKTNTTSFNLHTKEILPTIILQSIIS